MAGRRPNSDHWREEFFAHLRRCKVIRTAANMVPVAESNIRYHMRCHEAFRATVYAILGGKPRRGVRPKVICRIRTTGSPDNHADR